MIFKQQHMLRTTLLAIPLCLIVSAVGVTQDTTEGDDSAESPNTFQPKTADDVGFSTSGDGSSAPGGYGTGPFAGGYPAPAGGMLTNERLLQGTHIMISWSKNNDELRGFSQKSGEWTNLKIEKQEKLNPIVGLEVAAVRVGDTMAAYSGLTGTWDVLKLRKNSDARAVVSTNWVQTTDNDYLYTFAAAKGKWTSPNDPKFRPSEEDYEDAMEVYGADAGLPGAGPSPADSMFSASKGELTGLGSSFGSSTLNPIDAEALQIAQKYRGKGLDNDEARKALTKVVELAFDQRQKQQSAEAQRLAEKLKKIQEAIEKRESLRDKIIQRRVDGLLDPNIEWDKAFPGGTPSPYTDPGLTIPGTAPGSPDSSR